MNDMNRIANEISDQEDEDLDRYLKRLYIIIQFV